jgi:hypothetical protein
VPAIVDAIYRAFSLATASTYVLGIGAAIVASGLVLLLREAPMRSLEATGTLADRPALPAVGEPT